MFPGTTPLALRLSTDRNLRVEAPLCLESQSRILPQRQEHLRRRHLAQSVSGGRAAQASGGLPQQPADATEQHSSAVRQRLHARPISPANVETLARGGIHPPGTVCRLQSAHERGARSHLLRHGRQLGCRAQQPTT